MMNSYFPACLAFTGLKAEHSSSILGPDLTFLSASLASCFSPPGSNLTNINSLNAKRGLRIYLTASICTSITPSLNLLSSPPFPHTHLLSSVVFPKPLATLVRPSEMCFLQISSRKQNKLRASVKKWELYRRATIFTLLAGPSHVWAMKESRPRRMPGERRDH